MTSPVAAFSVLVSIVVLMLLSQGQSFGLLSSSSVSRCRSRNSYNRRVDPLHRPLHSRDLAMAADTDSVVVVGAAGGVAESIVAKLLSRGNRPVKAIFDELPVSPPLLAAIEEKNNALQVFCGDFERGLTSPTAGTISKEAILDAAGRLMGDSVLVVADDFGEAELRAKIGRANSEEEAATKMMSQLVKVLPNNIKAVIACNRVVNEKKGIESLFTSKAASEELKKWCDDNNKPMSVFRYGKFIGGIPGAEPLPFIGLPLMEPELDPSYVLQSVLFADPTANQFASTEVCSRDSMAEAVVRLCSGASSLNAGLDTLVVSIVGKTPTDTDWAKLFSRLTPTSNAELLRIDFAEILKPKPLVNWIVDSWFPQALIEADAAIVTKGARPVRASKTSDSTIDISWEKLMPDLTVKQAGKLQIRLTLGEKPNLSVVRLTDGTLAGESQLIDKLIEGINSNAYKKQFCTPAAN